MEDYKYCGTGNHPMNITVTPIHSIHYVGPPVLKIRLAYLLIDQAVDKVKVNTSTNITYLKGTFQKNIEIDASEQPVYISITLRKFTGYTDYCKYGGMQMYHRVSMAVPPDGTKGLREAYVPDTDKEHESLVKVNKQHMYLPICTNESIVFQRKFYLDLGITNLIFYGYSSMFEIDVTLSVYPSVYTSLFNLEMNYCGKFVDVYIFKSFIINCIKRIIELKEHIPFTLQWSGDAYNFNQNYGSLEWFWPGQMNMKMIFNYLSYVSVKREEHGYTPCTLSDNLRIFDSGEVIKISLNTLDKVPMRYILNAESVSITRRVDRCKYVAVIQYSMFIDPAVKESRCSRSQTNFPAIALKTYYKVLKRCVSLNMLFQQRDNLLLIMGAYYRFPYNDTWVYYYLHVQPQCYQNTKMTIYYTGYTAKYNRVDSFEFTREKSYFTFYDYGKGRQLQFTFRRRPLGCRAFLHMTEKPAQQPLLDLQPALRGTKQELVGLKSIFKVFFFSFMVNICSQQ